MESACKAIVVLNTVNALVTHVILKTYDPLPLRLVITAFITTPFLATLSVIGDRSAFTSGLALAYPVFCTILILSVCLYRLSPWHPLAKYPGPVILKLTKMFGTWIAYKGKTHLYMKELHDTYGPIVRIGPNELSTTDKDLIPQILGNQGMPKGHLWDGRRFENMAGSAKYQSLIGVRDSVVHAKLRYPWNKAFSAGPLKAYEELLIRRVVELNDRIKDSCSGGIILTDIAKWFSYFSYDFMGDLAFAGRFRLMQEGDKDGVVELMKDAMHFLSISQHVPWMSALMQSLPIFSTGLSKFHQNGLVSATQRSETEMKRKDLFYYMGEASENPGIDFHTIANNAFLAIVAGSDTTASVLSNAVYLLLSHPDQYELLRREVDEAFDAHDIMLDKRVFGEDGTIDKTYSEELGGLAFLNAVINETLRLFPAVPASLQRAPPTGTSPRILRLADEDIVLPQGNAINVPPYVLHRDPRYFYPKPDAFIPERWLSTSTDTKYITSRSAFIPFSVGPQNCVGRPLALIELRYVLAILIRNFDMSFAQDVCVQSQWERQLQDRFTLHTGALKIRVSVRRLPQT